MKVPSDLHYVVRASIRNTRFVDGSIHGECLHVVDNLSSDLLGEVEHSVVEGVFSHGSVSTSHFWIRIPCYEVDSGNEALIIDPTVSQFSERTGLTIPGDNEYLIEPEKCEFYKNHYTAISYR